MALSNEARILLRIYTHARETALYYITDFDQTRLLNAPCQDQAKALRSGIALR